VAFAIAVATAAIVPTNTLASDGYNLTGFHVREGDIWHSFNQFLAEWDPNPPGSGPVTYTLREANWDPIPGYPMVTTNQSVAGGVRAPGPGSYLFIAWNPGGPVVSAPIHFDDVRPAPAQVSAPIWTAAGRPVQVRLAGPAAPLPVSGIAGYAVTIDSAADGSPCAAAHCGAAEITVPGGGNSITFPSPPEGISYVHAAAVSGSGMESATVATARVGVDGTPPVVQLEGVPDGWGSGPVQVSAVAVDRLSGMAAAGANGPITALAVDGDPPLITAGDRAVATVAGEGVHRVDFYGRDAVGNSGDGSLPFVQPGSATVRIDESGPTVRFAVPDPGDPERIEATVADALSGPDPDRGSIAVRAVGGSARFQPLPTDARRGRLVARWNSDDFPHGPYEFRATGFDQAGNAAATTLGAGGSAFVLQNPVKRESRLAFGFGAGQLVFQRCSRGDGGRRCHRVVVRSFAGRPPGRTVPCCHGAVVGGRLVDASGAPLAGQTVEVVETFADGARNGARRTALATDTAGRFSTRLSPGPSRTVIAEFPGTGRLTRTAGRQIRLRVRAALHLRTSAGHAEVGGPPVLFSGRIAHPEAPIPAAGLPVQLEFRLPGMPWTEFRTVQSDASGHFRYPYSFSDDDSAGARFQFRAFVPAAGGWPFAPATSRPVAVTG
jgi:hypothetical protein